MSKSKYKGFSDKNNKRNTPSIAGETGEQGNDDNGDEDHEEEDKQETPVFALRPSSAVQFLDSDGTACTNLRENRLKAKRAINEISSTDTPQAAQILKKKQIVEYPCRSRNTRQTSAPTGC